ncbi:zinc-finger domain-containing protein [Flavisolibacter sp. BT320]|nr:zinc-finger domain-containing protein [Flavisolibacter longurius]
MANCTQKAKPNKNSHRFCIANCWTGKVGRGGIRNC